MNFEESFHYYRMIDDGTLITADQVCEQYKLTKQSLRQAVKGGEIANLRLYGAEYYHRDEIELFIENRNKQASSEEG